VRWWESTLDFEDYPEKGLTRIFTDDTDEEQTTAKATTGPPFDFVQGVLFEDDSKSKGDFGRDVLRLVVFALIFRRSEC
jgi:hypothetical protein